MSLRKTIQSVGAVAWKTGQPLTIETVNVASPKPGEVRFMNLNLRKNNYFMPVWVWKGGDKGAG